MRGTEDSDFRCILLPESEQEVRHDRSFYIITLCFIFVLLN